MKNAVVLDLETKQTFQEAGSRDPKDLGVSLVGTYSYETDSFNAFREEDFDELFWLLERASVVVGFNINHFDFPVLQAYYVGSLSKLPTLDLLETVKQVIGKRIALDEFAKETLKSKKSEHGLDAINYFKSGDWESLEKYCLDDVKITRDLYDYDKKHGAIYYMSPWGRKEVRVDWSSTENNGTDVNLTLGI